MIQIIAIMALGFCAPAVWYAAMLAMLGFLAK